MKTTIRSKKYVFEYMIVQRHLYKFYEFQIISHWINIEFQMRGDFIIMSSLVTQLVNLL